jgi:hypothetical protein
MHPQGQRVRHTRKKQAEFCVETVFPYRMNKLNFRFPQRWLKVLSPRCEAIYSGRSLAAFWKSVLSLSSGFKIKSSKEPLSLRLLRWEQYVLPKRRWISTGLNSVIFAKYYSYWFVVYLTNISVAQITWPEGLMNSVTYRSWPIWNIIQAFCLERLKTTLKPQSG